MNADQDSTDDRPDQDLHRLDHLPLPAHVNVWLHGRWRPGWLIAYENQPSGWRGLVQHEDEHHVETTEWVAAEEITSRSNP